MILEELKKFLLLSGAAYFPNAYSESVNTFFKAIQPDEMPRAGLLRWLGYCFTGEVKFGTPEHPADHNLKKKMLLPENLNALLALLVGEAQAWYRDGLIISPLMKQETKRLHQRQLRMRK